KEAGTFGSCSEPSSPSTTSTGSPVSSSSSARLLGVGRDLQLHDLVALALGNGAVVGLRSLVDLVDELHARDDLAPDRVLAVGPGRVGEADEELAVGAVGIVRARHRKRAADMMLVRDLGLEVLARTAAAGARGISGLRHEAGDHAMKDDAVVEVLT